jgi:lysophospholipase L1-like esterase
MYSYLALGDSYTIGEGVAQSACFSYQTWAILHGGENPFHPPRIIAKTGWTTGELLEALAAATLSPPYDFVSLLIGVNNEFRGQRIERYADEFLQLLRFSLSLAGDRPGHVFILSIPDWSVTPFAKTVLPDASGRTQSIVAAEIDSFNQIAQRIAAANGVDFINITEHTRQAAAKGDPSWLTPDLLHPSAGEYAYWAEELASRIDSRIAITK